MVQHTPQEGGQDLGGQKKKLQQLTAVSVGRGAALLGRGRGKCVTLLVSALISVMDELSSKTGGEEGRGRGTKTE